MKADVWTRVEKAAEKNSGLRLSFAEVRGLQSHTGARGLRRLITAMREHAHRTNPGDDECEWLHAAEIMIGFVEELAKELEQS